MTLHYHHHTPQPTMTSTSSEENLPFVVEEWGSFTPSQVKVYLRPTPRPTTPELEKIIAREWEIRMAEARRTGRDLFNGELLRYISHETANTQRSRTSQSEIIEELHLTVGPTCYRDFVGTNLYNHDRLTEFGWHQFANPIGTTAILRTTDQFIVLGRRSSRVAYHAEHVHTFGGALEPRDRISEDRIDPFSSVRRELHEEAALSESDISELICVGLIRDKEIHQPELLFEAELNIVLSELIRRFERAQARNEHAGLTILQEHPDLVLPFLSSRQPIAPVAVGSLLLRGRRIWGEAWYDSIVLRFGEINTQATTEYCVSS
jgi:hypothetical protein